MTDDVPTQVLIIDGDSVRRGMVSVTLPSDLYTLSFAKTAEEGLDRVSELGPHIIVVGLDDSTGDLCERIRSLPAGIHSVVALMDEGFRDERRGSVAAEAAGADVALPFPFDEELFEARLQLYRQNRMRTSNHLSIGIRAAAGVAAQRPVKRRTAPPEPSTWEAFRARIDAIHAALDQTDYYELLKIPNTASAAEIKEGYYARSMEFHPDRFMQLDDQELRGRIYDVYKRMSEGFKVLINPEVRSKYDQGLAGPERDANMRYVETARPRVKRRGPNDDAETPAGKKYLHFARLAEEEGNLKSARMYLTLASQCEPQNQALRQRLDSISKRL